MVNHPLYTMWKQRHDAELVTNGERLKLRALRDDEQRQRGEAWEAYVRHWYEGRDRPSGRRWCSAASERCLALAVWILTPPAKWAASWLRRRA